MDSYATTNEIDFIDAGHIRVAEVISSTSTSFNSKSIEVLDYKLNEKDLKSTKYEAIDISKYAGKYQDGQTGRVFDVSEKEGNLTVEIPGQAILPFNLPDHNGRWQCRIAPHISISFEENNTKGIAQMLFYQSSINPKRSDFESANGNITSEYFQIPGKYFFTPGNTEITIHVKDGNLVVIDPNRKDPIRLLPSNQPDVYIDEKKEILVSFLKDNSGNVIGIRVEMISKFNRIE
jgi:hypothetical protein